MTKTIKHNFFFPQKPEAVWEYLTKAELIAQWLMPNNFQPVVGCDFQFRIPPMPKLNFDGIAHCKVLEIVPFKKLSYSWKSGPGEGQIALDSVVVWTLHTKDNGTELRLEHSGFKEADIMMYTSMNDGWLKQTNKIAELLNPANHGTTNA